ncbi:unnamed protein product [Angiostrongylus costaricensis]|uniref:EGF-like domain-containing protein n=1 Tax=Angiostrongylus costaricensis TaxID=334426 RepID=A0A0R3PA11_ANGCS|nr:unnamed protein product [Angiostrongylus costaricensis]
MNDAHQTAVKIALSIDTASLIAYEHPNCMEMQKYENTLTGFPQFISLDPAFSVHFLSLLHLQKNLTLTVDGRKDEIRQYAPELDWIGHSFAYLGSVPLESHNAGVTRNAFRGCMKQVKYDADAQRILFVKLADQGFGGSIIKTGGELAFSCKGPAQPPDVLSFHSASSSFLALPKWGALASGKMTDYVAFELIDGHLHMIINLGSGAVRLQRIGRTGSVIVDSMKTDFNTPGVSSNLIVDDPIYLGWVPNTTVPYPPSIWSISLRKGFIGCLRNLRVNGISARIASVFEHSNTTGISIGCPPTPAVSPCAKNPCYNFGHCEPLENTFTCDCAATNKEGPTCNIDYLPSSVVLKINEISCGLGFTKSNESLPQPFRGSLSRMEERSKLHTLLVDNTTAISANRLQPQLGNVVAFGETEF